MSDEKVTHLRPPKPEDEQAKLEQAKAMELYYTTLQEFPAHFVNDIALVRVASMGNGEPTLENSLMRLVMVDHLAMGVIAPEVRGAAIVTEATLRAFVKAATKILAEIDALRPRTEVEFKDGA